MEDYDALKQNEKFLKDIIEKIRMECAARVRKEMLNGNDQNQISPGNKED